MPITPPVFLPGQYPNIAPFTIRENPTFLHILESMRAWISNTLVPYVNENVAGIADSWNENAIEIVNAFNAEIDRLILEMAENAIELQDPVMSELLVTLTSETRIALDEILSDFYTKTSADETFETKEDSLAKAAERYTKTQVDDIVADQNTAFNIALLALQDALETAIGEVDGRVTDIETLTETGRLGESELDTRYEKRFNNPVAVFIGSSNAEPSRLWVDAMSIRNGWIPKNFSVGGGGFNQPGALSFYNQAVNAVNDTSFDKAKVKYVFVIDVSNDTRGKTSISSPANTVFTMLELNYPNARIIVVPEVMTLAAPNYTDKEILWWMTRHYNELRNTAQNYRRVEVINNTWLWFWDTGSWTAGETIDVHLNTAGYNRLAWFIEQYVLHGISHDNDLGDNTGSMAVGGSIHARRSAGVTSIFGTINLAADQTTSIAMAQLHRCFAHAKDPIPVIAWRKTDGATKTLELSVTGALNNQIVIPAGLWMFSVSFVNI